MTRFSPLFVIVMIWAVSLGAAAQFGKFAVMLDRVAASYPLQSAPMIGLAVSSVGFAGLVLGTTAGLFASGLGYRRVMVVALIAGSALSFAQSLGPSFPLLLALRGLEGFAHLAIVVAAPVLTAQVASPRFQAAAMTLYSSFFSVSFMVLGFIGPGVVDRFGVAGLLQGHAGYPDNIIGMIVGFRGIGGTIGFFCAMFIGRLDPRLGLTTGFGLLGLSGVWLMEIDLNVSSYELLLNSVVQGMATGIVWVPLSVMAFSTLEQRFMAEGMAVFHLLRNLGSSLFISIAVAQIIQSTSANYSRLSEVISPYNRVLDMPWVMGAWTVDTLPGLAKMATEINRQAAMIGYLNAFSLYTATSFAAILLVWLIPRRRSRVA